MANEFRKVTDQNGVDHPVTDDNRVTWSANTVLGAKNLANFVNGKGINTSGAVVDDVNRIATVEPITIETGKRYRYIGEDVCLYAVWNGNTMVRRETGIYGNTILNTDGGDRFYVCCYSSSGAVTVDSAKAMVILSTDSDHSYAPFAMTNRELTEQAQVVTGNITAGEGVTKNDSWTQVKKKFGVASVSYRFQVGSADISTDGAVIGVLTGIKALLPITFVKFVNRDASNEIVLGMLASNGNIVLMGGYTLGANKTYLMAETFLVE